MIRSVAETCVWVGIVYLVERRRLKKSNGLTRWTAIFLLLLSGLVWQTLINHVDVPRPYSWLDALLGPLVPVS